MAKSNTAKRKKNSFITRFLAPDSTSLRLMSMAAILAGVTGVYLTHSSSASIKYRKYKVDGNYVIHIPGVRGGSYDATGSKVWMAYTLRGTRGRTPAKKLGDKGYVIIKVP